MKRKAVFAASFVLLAGVAIVCTLWLSEPALGIWAVTSEFPGAYDVSNHTYEFRPDHICIEKYRSEQMIGPWEGPPESVEMDTVIRYQFRRLDGNMYRLFPLSYTVQGRPTYQVPAWQVLDIEIAGSAAIVSRGERQITQIEQEVIKSVEQIARESMRDPVTGRTPPPQKAKSKPVVTQMWERNSWRCW